MADRYVNWQAPDSPWDKAMRQFTASLRLIVGTFGVLVISVFVWAIVTIFRLDFNDSEPSVLPMVLLALVFSPVFLFSESRAWRRNKRVFNVVPPHDAMVCPTCVIPLSVGDHADTCPRCGETWSKPHVSDFWEDYASLKRWAYGSLERFRDPRGRARWRQIQRRRAILGILFVAIAFILLFAAMPVGLAATAAIFLPLIGMILCAGFIATGISHRVFDGRYCVKCKYQLAPTGPWPTCCPECGVRWDLPGSTVTGRRRTRSDLIVAGICALVITSMPTAAFGPQWGLKLLPTSVLIAEAASPRWRQRAMQQLAKRDLSPDEIRALAQALVRNRYRHHFGDLDADAWFAAQLPLNQIPDDVVTSYYHGAVSFGLDVSGEPRVGRSATVSVSVKRNHRLRGLDFSVNAYVYPTGFAVDDGGIAGTGSYTPNSIFFILSRSDPDWFTTLTPASAGPMRVRFVYWLVILPKTVAQAPQIKWQRDGQPVLPAQTMWSKRFEIERVIEVAP